MRPRFLVPILVLLALTFPVSPAHAAGVVSVCDEAHLRAALSGGGTVTFACSGTVTLTSTITIAADTTVDGTGQYVTISGNNAIRIFVLNSGISLSLNKLTIANGKVTGTNGGGGVLSSGGKLTINNTVFSGNSAQEGGAIFSDGGTVTAATSWFVDNSASYNGGVISAYSSTVTVTGTDFMDNSAGNGGAAIYAVRGQVSVSNSSFHTNSARIFSGAIYEDLGMLTVTNTIFDSNSGGSLGGAIMCGGTLSVSNSTFYGNSAASGAGLYNDGTASVIGTTFRGNIASSGGTGHGGGITNANTLTVSNSTIALNTGDYGGGISNEAGTITVLNSTIASNRGGGIYNPVPATLWLQNTIVANQTSGSNCSGTVTDGGANLSYPDRTCPGINANPYLGPLRPNGGPTETMALGSGSAALDRGNDAVCAASPVNNLDQRGVTRPQGAHCDIGAVEQQPVGAPVPPSPWLAIDIKPGSDPNTINCRNADEVITVAILTTETFAATTLDGRTVSFAGARETHVDKKTGEPRHHLEDIDGDGDMDLVFHFRMGSTHLTCASTRALLLGRTISGQLLWGADAVRMVGGG